MISEAIFKKMVVYLKANYNLPDFQPDVIKVWWLAMEHEDYGDEMFEKAVVHIIRNEKDWYKVGTGLPGAIRDAIKAIREEMRHVEPPERKRLVRSQEEIEENEKGKAKFTEVMEKLVEKQKGWPQ